MHAPGLANASSTHSYADVCNCLSACELVMARPERLGRASPMWCGLRNIHIHTQALQLPIDALKVIHNFGKLQPSRHSALADAPRQPRGPQQEPRTAYSLWWYKLCRSLVFSDWLWIILHCSILNEHLQLAHIQVAFSCFCYKALLLVENLETFSTCLFLKKLNLYMCMSKLPLSRIKFADTVLHSWHRSHLL